VSRNTVAAVVVDGLRRAGTPRLFAVTGSEAHPLCGAACAAELPLTLASTEAAACIMAAVAGDLVEAPGAALIESPGAAAIAAVERAAVDRAPLVVLTERHPHAMLAAKASLGVTPESAAHWIAHASRLAGTEPRGPVHLDAAPDALRRPALPVAASCRPDPLPPADLHALDAAARLLADASRPLLLAGLHCRSAAGQPWVRALVEALPAPMLVTLRAKGALPDPHPLMLGVLGIESIDERLLKLADLVVTLGLDACEAVPGPWRSTVRVLAIGPPQTGGDPAPAVEVAGEIGVVLEELAPRLQHRDRADWDVAELDRLKRARSAARRGGDAARATRDIVRLAREALPAGTIAAVDAGSYRADVAEAWHAVAPRELLASGGRDPGGFALPAAIAAHLVHPDRRVICFTGADELPATAGELDTARRLDAPVIVVVFVGPPAANDVIRIAERARLAAFSAEGAGRFGEALSRAMHTGGPALIAVTAPTPR
jgi:acetolactate synthase I/II/III large subunit